MKTKHLVVGVFSALSVIALALLTSNNSMAANTNTNTTLGIKTGVLSFFKDTTTSMDSYFSHSGNQSSAIDIGSYDADVVAISAASSGDHRFTVSDLAGKSFAVTVVSSDLTAVDYSGAQITIDKANVSYTGTTRAGTGKALTASPTGSNIGTSQTFVARNNHSGVSKFSQEITLKVAVPAAQAPGAYTGMLTFTY